MYYQPQQGSQNPQYNEYNQQGYGYQQSYGNQPPYGQPYASAPPVQPAFQQGPPPSGPSSPNWNRYNKVKEDGNKFPESPKYRDAFWALLFVLHLIAVVVLLIVGIAKDGANIDFYGINTDEFRKVISVSAITVGTAMCLSFIWLTIVRKFAKQLIWGTLVGSMILCFAFGVFLFAQGSVWGGIIFILIGLLNILFIYWWRSRIPFATAMLETISDLIRMYPATAWISVASLVAQAVFIALLVYTVSLSSSFASSFTTLLTIFYLLSLYWTTQVIRNTVHVTASGTFATWYFLQATGMPANPTLKSMKRALTTSFGSICLGSLLVALLQTLRTLLRSTRNQRNAIFVWIVDCILGCIEGLIRYFNLYAFTQVAIYGKAYCEAAKDTWSLISSHGLEAIINDNLIGNVLSLGAFLGAVITALVGGIAGAVLVNDQWVLCAVIGFLIGYSILSVCMEVVQSGSACILVCFAMEKDVLRVNNPNLYDKFITTYY